MSEEKHIGHTHEAKTRTIDVEIDKNITFEQLCLHPTILAGLKRNNFIYPSPIQLRAIPIALCGQDLFIQAKSGTGKTIVFTVRALDLYLTKNCDKYSTTLVVAPTREIAVQIQNVMTAVACKIEKFHVQVCIGGTEIDRKKISRANCIVGTPGRLLHLIKAKILNPENVKLVVLDEADKLMTSEFKGDVKAIVNACEKRQQTLVVSATFNEEIEGTLRPFMKKPLGVTPKKEVPVLIGISQFFYQIPPTGNIKDEMKMKTEHLVKLLMDIDFNQCLIFVNSQSRAESYCNFLIEKGFSADFITGAQDQGTRLKTFERIQNSSNCKVIVTTDLLARGIDCERVNVVINLELPGDQFCYLHRIGRAGRFGSLGLAINLLSNGEELMKFKNILLDETIPIYKLTQENAKNVWHNVQNQTTDENYEKFFKNNDFKEQETSAQDLLQKFLTTESNLEENSEDFFIKKIRELQLYSEEIPKIEENVPPEEVKNNIETQENEAEMKEALDPEIYSQISTDDEFFIQFRESEHETSSSDDEEEEDSDDELSCSSASSLEYSVRSNQNRSSLSNKYHDAYERWTNMYWNQATQIQDYVRFQRYLQQNH